MSAWWMDAALRHCSPAWPMDRMPVFVAVFGPERFHDIVVALFDEIFGGQDLYPVLVDDDHGIVIRLRFVFQDQGGDAQLGQLLGDQAAGVGLLDAACQRRLSPGGEAAGIRSRRTGHYPWRKDKFVVLS